MPALNVKSRWRPRLLARATADGASRTEVFAAVFSPNLDNFISIHKYADVSAACSNEMSPAITISRATVFGASGRGFGLNIKMLIAGLALVSTVTSSAHAKTIYFNLTGPDPAFSFALDDAPVVESNKLGHYFSVAGHTFYSATAAPEGGGFDHYFGAQLYSGPESDPTFTPNNYQVLNGDTGNVDTLTIAWETGAPLPPAVPEPSTWAMMLVGFAGCGLAAYRRRKILTTA